MKAALIILDGWGLGNPDGGRDAVEAADTPNFDQLAETGAYGTLSVSGRRVGLPEGQMGNSEVGHLNVGAGRVVMQEYTRITDAIANGELGDNEAIASAFEHADENDSRVHFLGLVSEGGVHSDQRHLHALIELAAERGHRTTSDCSSEPTDSDGGIDAVTHAFTDGRDTAPKSGAAFLAGLQQVVDRAGTGDVATVSGRYYAMDRDQNWDRTKRAYDAIVEREAEYEAESAVAAVEASYERGDTDEFVKPTVVAGGPEMEGDSAPSDEDLALSDEGLALADGDAAVFFNFRADRARQLARMLADIRPDDWKSEGIDTTPPEIELVTMTEYDETFDLPVAFPPDQPADVLGEVLADHGLTQLRMAESEKYAHVTYFLNGGHEIEFPGESREIVASPDVATYDLQPEMSAAELTDTAIRRIEADDPDVLVLNYANPDMVGHTGDFDAAVAAVEAVDEQLGRLVAAVESAGGHALVTADHGNADDMGTPEDPHTAHTTNPVPFVYLSPGGDRSGGKRVRTGGSLCDVAPTLLSLIGVDQPAAMTGENLLE